MLCAFGLCDDDVVLADGQKVRLEKIPGRARNDIWTYEMQLIAGPGRNDTWMMKHPPLTPPVSGWDARWPQIDAWIIDSVGKDSGSGSGMTFGWLMADGSVGKDSGSGSGMTFGWLMADGSFGKDSGSGSGMTFGWLRADGWRLRVRMDADSSLRSE